VRAAGSFQTCRLFGSALRAFAVTYELCHCSQGPDENISMHALGHVTLPVMLALYTCRGVHACTHRHMCMYMRNIRVYAYCMLHYSRRIPLEGGTAGRCAQTLTNLQHTSFCIYCTQLSAAGRANMLAQLSRPRSIASTARYAYVCV